MPESLNVENLWRGCNMSNHAAGDSKLKRKTLLVTKIQQKNTAKMRCSFYQMNKCDVNIRFQMSKLSKYF